MLQKEGLSIPKTVVVYGIPRSSAYRMLDEFNSSDEHILSGTTVKSKTTKPKKLSREHTEFLIDQNPPVVLEEVGLQLLSSFSKIGDIAISSLHTHIREKYFIGLQKEIRKGRQILVNI